MLVKGSNDPLIVQITSEKRKMSSKSHRGALRFSTNGEWRLLLTGPGKLLIRRFLVLCHCIKYNRSNDLAPRRSVLRPRSVFHRSKWLLFDNNFH